MSRSGKDLLVRNRIYIPDGGERPVRDFMRLSLAWFFCLVFLGVYQQYILFKDGVLDEVFSRNLALLLFHHIGYVALFALLFMPLFKFIEKRSPRFAMGILLFFMTSALVAEFFLLQYFLNYYEPLVMPYFNDQVSIFLASGKVWLLIPAYVAAAIALLFFYQFTARAYQFISRMYPVTLILLGLVLMSYKTEKKPVNENKTQWLISREISRRMETIAYEGEKEYPLLKDYEGVEGLSTHFELQDSIPDIIFVVIDGLGAEMIGKEASYATFAPFMNSLASRSLYWENHLSGTRESEAAIPMILGSLPYGKEGFHKIRHGVHRQSLFSILDRNGYETGFHYGGNLPLTGLDYFLEGERVDHLTDRQVFNSSYEEQAPDRAGISAGYPDEAIYSRYLQEEPENSRPKIDFILNLSSRAPAGIPRKKHFQQQVSELMSAMPEGLHRRKVEKNKDFFNSILYADQSLEQFFEQYSEQPGYTNTIFVITGSHVSRVLTTEGLLQPFRVPLMIYSPLVKDPSKFSHYTSHADIMPSMLGLLQSRYNMDLPSKVSFTGYDLADAETRKEISLFHTSGQMDLLYGNTMGSAGQYYRLFQGEEIPMENEEDKEALQHRMQELLAINQYVTREDKLIPKTYAGYELADAPLNKEELVFVHSVFNGRDYDKAYMTARSLAFEGERERAEIICRYILSQVPVHADTHILLGRIHAWDGDYAQAIIILEKTISKYPHYADAYAALLDVYYWSGELHEAEALATLIEQRQIDHPEVNARIERAMNKR